MLERALYKNAPIVEAILAIELKCAVQLTLEDFGDVFDDYVLTNPLYESQFFFNVEDASAKGSSEAVGKRYISSDGKQLVQLKRDGFVFSRLAPYDRWESFFPEAQRLFELFTESLEQGWNVKGIIVRYINKLYLPMGPSLDTYLKVYAYLPEDFPSATQGYFVRLELGVDDPLPGTLTMQHVILQEPPADKYPVLIDNEFKFPTTESGERLWQIFERVRHLKNSIFERTLTPKAKDLIR